MPFAAKTSEKRTCPVPVSRARESSAARLRHSARTIREAPFAGGAELFEQRERPMSTYRGTDRRNGKSWASRLGKKGEDFSSPCPFFRFRRSADLRSASKTGLGPDFSTSTNFAILFCGNDRATLPVDYRFARQSETQSQKKRGFMRPRQESIRGITKRI